MGKALSGMAVIGLFALLVFSVFKPATAQTYAMEGAVVRVVDGDGLYVEGEKRQIRLFGVDAPERNEEGFREATQALAHLVEGKAVSVRYLYADRFGRVVGRVFVDGMEVNEELIRSGPATEYCKYSEGFYGTCRTS